MGGRYVKQGELPQFVRVPLGQTSNFVPGSCSGICFLELGTPKGV